MPCQISCEFGRLNPRSFQVYDPYISVKIGSDRIQAVVLFQHWQPRRSRGLIFDSHQCDLHLSHLFTIILKAEHATAYLLQLVHEHLAENG